MSSPSTKNRLSFTLVDGRLTLYVGGEVLIGPIPAETTTALAEALKPATERRGGFQCPCAEGWTFNRYGRRWEHPEHSTK